MRTSLAVSLALLSSTGGLIGATEHVAATFQYQRVLGAPVARLGGACVYWPWSIFNWAHRWRETYPRPFAAADLIVLTGMLGAGLGASPALAAARRRCAGTARAVGPSATR